MNGWTFVGALILAGGGYLLLSGFLRTWLKYRGNRIITCPENLQPAAVRVNALNAAKWTAVAGETDLHLKSCSRWPEMAGCAEDCLTQIESSPESCLVKTIVTQWYEGRDCAFCHKPVEKIIWHERPAALRAPDGTTREWKEIDAQNLPLVFKTHQAVCWPCHMRETFRREHGSWVVERPRTAEAHALLQPSTAVY
jgi:hypothetical protein